MRLSDFQAATTPQMAAHVVTLASIMADSALSSRARGNVKLLLHCGVWTRVRLYTYYDIVYAHRRAVHCASGGNLVRLPGSTISPAPAPHVFIADKFGLTGRLKS